MLRHGMILTAMLLSASWLALAQPGGARLAALAAVEVPATLAPSDPAEEARFGAAVALDGETAAVGAPGAPGGGAAYIFEYNGGAWLETARISADDADAGDSFGVALALAGDTLVVGASGDDEAGGLAGAAYVFRRAGAGWAQAAKLMPSSVGDARFGWSVALSEGRIAVGAPYSASGTINSGAAYLFEPAGAGWAEAARFATGGGGPVLSDLFGWSVALSGERLAVGAHLANTVHLFERGAGGWAPAGEVGLDPPAAGQFGYAVALQGDRLAVGAPEEDGSGNNAGAAYLFAPGVSGWEEQARLEPAAPTTGARFGWSVALQGDRLAMGARESAGPDDLEESGVVYLFEATAGAWDAAALLRAPDAAPSAHFGEAVALSGARALVGAPDAGAGARGAAYLFGVTGQPGPSPSPEPSPSPSPGPSPSPEPGGELCDDFASEDQTTEEVAPGVTLSYDSALRCRGAAATGTYSFTVTIENDADSRAAVVIERLLLTHTTPRPGGQGPQATGASADLPLTLAPGERGEVTVSGSFSLVTTGARKHANLHFCLGGSAADTDEPFSLGVNAFLVGAGSPDDDDEEGEDDGRGPPAISGVRVSVGSDRATITWTTDRPATGAVAYAAADEGEEELARGERCAGAVAHSVELTNLRPETSYSYRIVSASALGAAAATEGASFTTLSVARLRHFLPLVMR